MTLKALKSKLFSDVVEIPPLLQQSHLPALDGLRGISIILVIIGHALDGTPFGKYFNGYIGVNIFFVISGFLITTLLLKEKVSNGSVSFKNFYIRRALRIVPVSYLFLLILLIFNFHFKITALSFATAFLYLKNLPFKATGDWDTGHFWSLSVEEQFYILFPFFMISYLNKYIRIILVMILVLPILGLLTFNNMGIFYTNKVVHVIALILLSLWGRGTVCILTGSLFSILVFKKVILIEKLKSNYILSFCLLVLAIVARTIDFGRLYFNVVDFFFPFIISYLILLNIKSTNLLRNILSNRLLIEIGILSYSLYIWQQPFTGGLGANYFEILYHIAALSVVAYLSYYYFEKRFLRLKTLFKAKVLT